MLIQEALPKKGTATLKQPQVFLDSKISSSGDDQQGSFEIMQVLTGRVAVIHGLVCNSKALKSEIPQVQKSAGLS